MAGVRSICFIISTTLFTCFENNLSSLLFLASLSSTLSATYKSFSSISLNIRVSLAICLALSRYPRSLPPSEEEVAAML